MTINKKKVKREEISLRIIAFSDWHIQSIEQLLKWFESFEKPIDFIVYAGDGVSQFYESSYPEPAKCRKWVVVIGTYWKIPC